MHIYTNVSFDLLNSVADGCDWLIVFVGVENISLIYRLVRRDERAATVIGARGRGRITGGA
jgi:hypothetical protein